MKVYSWLAAVALLLTLVSSMLYFAASTQNHAGTNVSAEISALKQDYIIHHSPRISLNLEPLIQSRLSEDLLNPTLTLPHAFAYAYSEWRAFTHVDDSCADFKQFHSTDKNLQKAMLWSEYRCGNIKTLPAHFFYEAPFMHPGGKSYVSLALLSHRAEFSGEDWKREHRAGMHLLELLNLTALSSLPVPLTAWELQNLLQHASVVMANDAVFLPSLANEKNEARYYQIFSREEFFHALKSKRYLPVVALHSQDCVLKEGNVCWIVNPDFQNKPIRVLAIGLTLAFILLMTALLYLLVTRAQSQKKEAAQRLFILQTLTHELRTPTASLKLLIETFRNQYDDLPKESQKAFLMICDELQRLDRMVKESTRYLSNEGPTLERIQLNSFLENFLTKNFGGKNVIFKPLSEPAEVSLNSYSLELCLLNLIKNAFDHGAEPITLEMARTSKGISISVSDAGSEPVASFEEMTKPLSKGEQSKGLGLGLSIAQKAAKDLGSELTFRSSPSTFTFILKDQHD